MNVIGQEMGIPRVIRKFKKKKKNQMKILKLKTPMAKIKISFNGLNSRLDTAKDRSNKVEDIIIEIILTETQ